MQSRKLVIGAMCFGNALEWYEYGIYVYFAPVLSELFFSPASPLGAIVSFYLVLAIGFLSRPIGGMLFGYIGDRVGRRTAVVYSIVFMTIPTFLIGLLPTYAQAGWTAPFLLCVLRLCQGIPAGGEFPGTITYLVESGPPERRGFMGSWSFFGSQMGIVLNITEILLLERYLTHDQLASWGWRASFLFGGLIGVFGILLRVWLKETQFFRVIEEKAEVEKQPVLWAFKRYKSRMALGFLLACVPLMGGWMIFGFNPSYFQEIFSISLDQNLMISWCMIVLSTFSLPFFGLLGDRFDKKPLLIGSTIALIALAYPLYAAASSGSLALTLALEAAMTLILSFQFAMIPGLLADLFPTSVRFTGVAMSYNFCNSFLASITPVFSFFLIKSTGIATIPAAVFIGVSLLTLAALLALKEHHGHLRDL